jgi:hypothetical protein
MRIRLLSLLVLLFGLASTPLTAQVTLERGAVVYLGSASNTSAPATVVESKLRDATPEWKTIVDEDIDVDSARGKQLIVKMNKRIREAVKAVAASESRDLVTRKKDLKDDQGRSPVDLTDKVVEKIEE